MGIGGISSNPYAADMWANKGSAGMSSGQFVQQAGNMAAMKPREYKVYMKTDDMLYSGGNGSGLSFYIKYAEGSTKEDPTVVAKGVDENGKEFEQLIHINDINPRCATVVEMHALEAHLGVDKNGGLSSLPKDPSSGNMGLHDRADFIDLFRKTIRDMNTLGQKKLAAYYQDSLQMYWDFMEEKEKDGPDSEALSAPFGYWKKNLSRIQEKRPGKQDSNTDTEIITRPDGSRTLVMTTHIGETETVMSVKLSEPSAFGSDYVKAERKEAGTKRAEGETAGADMTEAE